MFKWVWSIGYKEFRMNWSANCSNLRRQLCGGCWDVLPWFPFRKEGLIPQLQRDAVIQSLVATTLAWLPFKKKIALTWRHISFQRQPTSKGSSMQNIMTKPPGPRVRIAFQGPSHSRTPEAPNWESDWSESQVSWFLCPVPVSHAIGWISFCLAGDLTWQLTGFQYKIILWIKFRHTHTHSTTILLHSLVGWRGR